MILKNIQGKERVKDGTLQFSELFWNFCSGWFRLALLLAFLGLMALINLFLGLFGIPLNNWLGLNIDLSLQKLLSFVFYPFTIIIGIPPADAFKVAELLGERIIVTEVVSYQHLAQIMASGELVHSRSAIVVSYALCGFAHIASLAIFVGGIGSLVPSRLRDLSQLGFRALLAATLACLQTGAVAGNFYTKGSILMEG